MMAGNGRFSCGHLGAGGIVWLDQKWLFLIRPEMYEYPLSIWSENDVYSLQGRRTVIVC